MKKAALILLLTSGITSTTFAAKQWQPLRTPKAYANMLGFTYGHMFDLSHQQQRELKRILVASQENQITLSADAAHNALLVYFKDAITWQQYEYYKQCTTLPEYTLLDDARMQQIVATHK